MLTQNFKSAADLGISDKVYDALKKTLVLMETGQLIFYADPDGKCGVEDNRNCSPMTFHFNMDSWAIKHDCGTVRCIGGTAEALGRFRFEMNGGKEKLPDALDDLFYPYEVNDSWSNITVEQGAQALRNYLTYGEARWDEVMENNNG